MAETAKSKRENRTITVDFYDESTISTKSLLPNLTILLDIDPKIAIKRITQNNRETNKFDLKDLNFHKKVAKAYLSLANESKRFAVFDANKSIDELKSEVLSYILKKIKFF